MGGLGQREWKQNWKSKGKGMKLNVEEKKQIETQTCHHCMYQCNRTW
jgi:hypothetical protein